MAVNTRKIGRIIEVELTKGPENFGFSVTTRDNPIGGNYPIYIKNILPKVSSNRICFNCSHLEVRSYWLASAYKCPELL